MLLPAKRSLKFPRYESRWRHQTTIMLFILDSQSHRIYINNLISRVHSNQLIVALSIFEKKKKKIITKSYKIKFWKIFWTFFCKKTWWLFCELIYATSWMQCQEFSGVWVCDLKTGDRRLEKYDDVEVLLGSLEFLDGIQTKLETPNW